MNSVDDNMIDSDNLRTKLDEYNKFFNIQDASLTNTITQSHDNIGDVLHMTYKNGKFIALVIHKKNGTLLTYYK